MLGSTIGGGHVCLLSRENCLPSSRPVKEFERGVNENRETGTRSLLDAFVSNMDALPSLPCSETSVWSDVSQTSSIFGASLMEVVHQFDGSGAVGCTR